MFIGLSERSFRVISTHTLTWSVTEDGAKWEEYLYISTHTLTWSVTLTPARYFCFNADFNSHAHVERDAPRVKLYFPNGNFNSHAHVERDVMRYVVTRCEVYFNSHAHVERDILILLRKYAQKAFQLTRSRGA